MYPSIESGPILADKGVVLETCLPFQLCVYSCVPFGSNKVYVCFSYEGVSSYKTWKRSIEITVCCNGRVASVHCVRSAIHRNVYPFPRGAP